MDSKRRLELICGMVTGGIGIAVIFGALYVTKLTAEILQEPAPIGSAFVVSLGLYGLPALLVATGAYTHAVKRWLWGRALLITASLFLIILFFVSFVVLVWSRWVLLSWLIFLLTGFATLTSVASFFVRSDN
jgi:hypothetical protein